MKWFDAYAALADIREQQLSTDAGPGANHANRANPDDPISTSSTISTPPSLRSEIPRRIEAPRKAEAIEATDGDGLNRFTERTDAAAYPYGTSPAGRPLTYTGRVVSLEAWRTLSDFEKHGPGKRVWCGIRRAWVDE